MSRFRHLRFGCGATAAVVFEWPHERVEHGYPREARRCRTARLSGLNASNFRSGARERTRSAKVCLSSTERNASRAPESTPRNAQLEKIAHDALSGVKQGTSAMSGSVYRTTSPRLIMAIDLASRSPPARPRKE